MKKVMCMLLVFAVMTTCCMIGASAKCTIGDTLQAKMEATAEDEAIRVFVWIYPIHVSEDEIHRQAMIDAGFSVWEFGNLTSAEMSRYIIARRAIEFAIEELARDNFIEKYAIPEECINYDLALYINANLTKAQIAQFATYNEVDCIFYDDVLEEDDFTHPTETPVDPPQSGHYYESRFVQQFEPGDDWYHYEELYYHTDNSGETDWALVYACLPMCSPIELVTVVGNRVVTPGSLYEPFAACYGIYDVKNDCFIDAATAEANSYDGFLKTFDKIGRGRLIGDIDRDDEISILDVTIIQRCEANMRDYPEDDSYWLTFEQSTGHWYSDFNRDGARDILDATCIQRYLLNW